MTLTRGHEVQRLPLRGIAAEFLTGHEAADVLRQYRPLAHRIDAGLRQLSRQEGGDVADRENVLMPRSPQGCVDLDEAVPVELQPGGLEPSGGRGLGCPDDLVGRKAGMPFDVNFARPDLRHMRIRDDRNAALAEHATELALKPRGKGGEDFRGGAQQRECQQAGLQSGGGHIGRQPPLHRQREFDAGGAATDHDDAASAGPLHDAAPQRLEPFEKAVDRLHRYRMLQRPRNVAGVGRRPDIERNDIVRDGRRIPAQHATRIQIEAYGLRMEKPCPRCCCERHGVNPRLLQPIDTRDQPWQHPGIGRVSGTGDQRKADAGRRGFGERPQHLDMGVTGPDQDDVLRRRQLPTYHFGNHCNAPTSRLVLSLNSSG